MQLITSDGSIELTAEYLTEEMVIAARLGDDDRMAELTSMATLALPDERAVMRVQVDAVRRVLPQVDPLTRIFLAAVLESCEKYLAAR